MASRFWRAATAVTSTASTLQRMEVSDRRRLESLGGLCGRVGGRAGRGSGIGQEVRLGQRALDLANVPPVPLPPFSPNSVPRLPALSRFLRSLLSPFPASLRSVRSIRYFASVWTACDRPCWPTAPTRSWPWRRLRATGCCSDSAMGSFACWWTAALPSPGLAMSAPWRSRSRQTDVSPFPTCSRPLKRPCPICILCCKERGPTRWFLFSRSHALTGAIRFCTKSRRLFSPSRMARSR